MDISTLKSIFDYLLAQSTEEIDLVLLELMKEGKITAHRILDLYVRSIEAKTDDYHEKLSEASATMIQLITGKKRSHDAVHRALYDLNLFGHFNMETLNEEMGYDKEKDRELSFYGRMHHE